MTFQEINQIDVSKHTEQKMNLTYLSWPWAHSEMKKIDENAEITIHEFADTDFLHASVSNGIQLTPEVIEATKINYKKDKAGAYVNVSVTLNGRTETEYLPVMDFKNKAMTNPDAMAINKAHKRCFVKALALHGLGLYIYSGEDTPEQPPVEYINAQDLDILQQKIVTLSELTDGDTNANKGKLTTWVARQAKAASMDQIPKDYMSKLVEALDRMIAKNQPEEEQPEQDSLLEGNTTTPKED